MEIKVYTDCPLGITARWPWEKEAKPVKAWDKTCQYFCPYCGGEKDGTVICNVKSIKVKPKNE